MVRFHSLIISLVSLCLLAGAAQANLISNGDFATGDFTDWNTDGSSNTFVIISDSILPGTPKIAIIGAGNTSGTRYISQEFTVPTVNHWLTVSFDYGFGGLTRPGVDLFEAFVDIDGSGIGSVELLSVASGSGFFLIVDTVTMMFEVTMAAATSPNATISFVLDESGRRFSGFSGAGVDNIEITAEIHVPEPGTLVLFGLGLAGLSVIRRRKRVA